MSNEGRKGDRRGKDEEVRPAGVSMSFEGLLKGLGKFMESVVDLAEKGEDLRKSGEFEDAKGKLRGTYGVNISLGRKGRPEIQRFGTKRPTVKPEEEVREPLVDVFEEDQEITVTAEMPGVEEGDIQVEVKDGKLEINAEGEERKYSREIDLPSEVEQDFEMSFRNGVLELRLNKA